MLQSANHRPELVYDFIWHVYRDMKFYLAQSTMHEDG